MRSGTHNISTVGKSAVDTKTGEGEDPKIIPGTIVTECVSNSLPARTKPSRIGLHRKTSSGETEHEFGDEVELRNIRVQTMHTREEARVRTESVESAEWDSREGVVGEKIV